MPNNLLYKQKSQNHININVSRLLLKIFNLLITVPSLYKID